MAQNQLKLAIIILALDERKQKNRPLSIIKSHYYEAHTHKSSDSKSYQMNISIKEKKKESDPQISFSFLYQNKQSPFFLQTFPHVSINHRAKWIKENIDYEFFFTTFWYSRSHKRRIFVQVHTDCAIPASINYSNKTLPQQKF